MSDPWVQTHDLCPTLLLLHKRSVREALLTQILPTPSEAKQAEETSRLLSSRLRSKTPLRLRVVGAPEDETVVLPASALKMLVGILNEMGRGNTITGFRFTPN